jgi:choline dehydrogenase-like flavoprotein
MIYDIENIETGKTLTTEVCIIGSGPAGLSVADTIARKSDKKVIILESGSFDMEQETESLSGGTKNGILEEELEELHARRVGGTANHWILKLADKSNGYRYAELDVIDFEERGYIPYSGWPISKENLIPFYNKARERYCDLGTNHDLWAPHKLNETLNTESFAFGPTSIFSDTLPKKIDSSKQIDLYTHANVTKLLYQNGRISSVQIKTLSGKEFQVAADTFVLAGGGFDVPKLLLQSNVGNEYDVVGRYYIDHSLVIQGYFSPQDLNIIKDYKFLDMRLVEGKNKMRFFSFTRSTLLENRIPNFATMVFPKPGVIAMNGHRSAQRLAECILRKHALPTYKGAYLDFINVFKALPYLVRLGYKRYFKDISIMPGLATGGWSKIANLSREFKRIEVMSLVEQHPHPDNRVTLSDQQDLLGMPQLHVNLEWHDQQLEDIQRGSMLMLDAIQKAIPGIGEYQLPNPEEAFYSNTAHHLMGTTRMGSDVRTSVVDRDCKVHNVGNLFIAGSSVFPTGGFANPTLTIIALGIRLGEHIACAQYILKPVTSSRIPLRKHDVIIINEHPVKSDSDVATH